MTVGELEARMGNHEYIRWGVFLGRRAQREELAQKAGKR